MGTPICVDLDGTLVRTDTLVEGVLTLGLGKPLFQALLLLFGRRAALKAFVARGADIDPALLPYNEELLAWLRDQKASGRRLILATAADYHVARAVAEYLVLFDDVVASDGTENNKGTIKAETLVRHYGHGNFTYAGNSRADLSVWRAARSAILVNTPAGVAAAARRLVTVEAEIDDRPSAASAALRAMRPYQWVKNLLIFLPLTLSVSSRHGSAPPRCSLPSALRRRESI